MANGTVKVSQVDVLTTSGTGTISIVPPATNTNRTLTLPDQTATVATLTTPSFGTTIGVGGATASSSGAGVSFPATQSASTNANTLDDYEEGTFEITLTPNTSGSITVKTAEKYMAYTKLGRLVTVTGQVDIDSVSSPVGFYVTLAGLPYACNNWSSPSDGAGYSGGMAALYKSSTAGTGQTIRYIACPSNGGTSAFIYMDASTIAANNQLTFGFSYITET